VGEEEENSGKKQRGGGERGFPSPNSLCPPPESLPFIRLQPDETLIIV